MERSAVIPVLDVYLFQDSWENSSVPLAFLFDRVNQPSVNEVFVLCLRIFRELRDAKKRLEEERRDSASKDLQIHDLQKRIETGDGCKFFCVYH